MIPFPSVPENAIPLRRTFFRGMRQALEKVESSGDVVPLTKMLDKVEGWVEQARQTGRVDPRIDWTAWACGDMVSSQPSSTRPLPHILDAPLVPVALKARALTLTQTIEALSSHWAVLDEKAWNYGSIPMESWLLAASVPGIRTFVNEREGVQAPAAARWKHSERRIDLNDPWQWHHPWRNVLLNATDALQSQHHGRTGRSSAYTAAVRGAHERALFEAAMGHGWADPAMLDAWPLPYAVGRHHVATQRLQRVPLDPAVPGSPADLLAATESPGGLLEVWRAAHPHDWSTWVSPTTGTTLWRSLLLNENPGLLVQWLQDDPAALDRPIPMGTWVIQSDGIGNPRRAFAGTVWNQNDLSASLDACSDPSERKRLTQWWRNPAPSLRDTVWALTQHVFPAAVPFLERSEWQRLNAVIEGIDLRASLDQPSGGPESATGFANPLIATRSRVRL